MRTINEVLPVSPPELSTQWWYTLRMSVNSSLDKMMRLHTPKQIPIEYTPVVYWSASFVNGSLRWECAHASQTVELEESYDEYREAVTGQVQPLNLREVSTCDSCSYTSDVKTGEELHREQ